jgi:hypothetical protein
MAGVTGQIWVTAMAGAVTIGQMAPAELVTETPQMLWAVAVEMLAEAQLAGAR